MSSRTEVSRRTYLASLAAGSGVALSGCLSGLRAYVERDPPQQIDLTIKCLPADDDVYSIQIARHLVEHLETVGIGVELLPTAVDQLYRDVLLNRDFDVYVAQHPGHDDPDFLYPFLHSRFIEEPGWQNPFGYANVTVVDDLLERQRAVEGEERLGVLEELQRAVVEDCPFVTVAFPDSARAIRTDRFTGWQHHSLDSPIGFLAMAPFERSTSVDGEPTVLTLGTTDRRVTRNRNPIAVEFRFSGLLTGLLYDSLARRVEGELLPWMAREWSWEEDDAFSRLQIRLRNDLRWHDGEDLDASDVAFTFRFLSDTTMTEGDPVIPAPRYRGPISAIDQVWIVDDDRLEVRFEGPSRTIAEQVLEVPILPRHVWSDLTGVTEIVGMDVDHVTDALLWDNPSPVGSGPLAFEAAEIDAFVRLQRFEDHFLHRLPVGDPLESMGGWPRYAGVEFRILPSEAAIVEFLRSGEIDMTAWGLSASTVPRAGRVTDVSLRIERSSAFYHVGFDNRNAPLSNPRFRSAISRLIDRTFIINDVFTQYATPAISPVLHGARVPPDLEWSPDHERGFIGTPGTGTLDRDAARDLFREAGYLFRNGELQMRQ